MMTSESNENNIKLPNFVVVGAAKSGTTSLYHYLQEHPEVYLPDEYKETRFFASEKIKETIDYYKNSVFSFSEFQNLFKKVKKERAIGDFGNVYFQFPEVAIPNIKKYLGDNVKIVIILREPVERAFSAYQFACRNQYESVSFEYALEHEDERIKQYHFAPDIYHYFNHGLYYEKVKSYLEAFEEVKVIFFEDLRNKPEETLKDLFNFLGVSLDAKINIELKYNEGGWVPANLTIFNALFTGKGIANKIKPWLEKVPPLFYLGQKTLLLLQKLRSKLIIKKRIELKPETKEYLKEKYKEDIQKLEKLIKVDLSSWYNS